MGRVFLCPPGRPALAAMSLHSPETPRRLCGLLWPPGGYFASASSRARHTPKSKTAVKAICRPVTAFYTLMAIPYIHAPQNVPQKPPEARAWHKATPARSIRSKPGHCYLLREMDSTAQRSFSASHQAQRDPLHKGGLRAIRGGHPFAISISARISV